MNQGEMPIIGPTRDIEMIPLKRIQKCKTRHAAIQLCVAWSGLESGYVADRLGIDRGQFSRIMGGSAHFPDKKDDELMRVCGNYAPLQYSAWRHGFDLTARTNEARLRELEAERERLLSEIDRRDAA